MQQERINPDEISKEEFVAWENNIVTKFVKQMIQDNDASDVEFLRNGGTVAKDATITTEFILGRLNAYKLLLDIQFEEKPQYGH